MPKNISKLRVGFVIDDGMDQPDGVQQYILALGNFLQKEGHYVRYITGETKRTDIKGLIPLSRNLKVRFNGNTLSTPLPASKKKIREVLESQKFDILHIQMPYSPLMAARVIRLAPKNTRIIGTFHILPLGKLQYVGTKLLGYALKRNLRKFDSFLSVSPPARVFAQKVFGIKSEVLPNPVDIEKFRKSPDRKADKQTNIVYLGRLVPRKGCMHLLKALDLLLTNNKNLDISINICGDGNQRHKLQQFIESGNLRGKAVMHGFVSEKEKIHFLNNADLAIFPSVAGESFGIVLIEAMAAGSGVVLAGNNPGYSSVMHGLSECLFDPNDTEGLALKIKDIIEGDSFERLHKKQQEMVEKFDIKMVGNKLLQVYANQDNLRESED